MDNKDVNQEFLDFINSETVKMLANFSTDQTQQAFAQFNQQWQQLNQKDYSDPSSWLDSMFNIQKQHLALWSTLIEQSSTQTTPVIDSDQIEQVKEQIFEYIKKSYIATTGTLTEMAKNSGLEPHEQEKLNFYTKQ